MFLPGISRKLAGMCYNVSYGGSAYASTPGSLVLRVPFIEQKHVNQCADATARMIVQAWGFATSSMAVNTRGPLKGSTIQDHADISPAGRVLWRDGPVAGNLAASGLASQLAQLGPLAANMSGKLGGHFVVVIGVYSNNDEVVVHDPWSGPFKIRQFAEFKKHLSAVGWLDKVGQTRVNATAADWAH